MAISIRQIGDTAQLVEGVTIGSHTLPSITDIVPAFGSTAAHFDPTQTTSDAVAAWIARQPIDAVDIALPRQIELPILYGTELGPDLETIAERVGISIDEVVRRHAAAEYTVGAIGFQPGFPYLEGLPPELQTPRQATPRVRVPAGSVGIGGPYTGVYPQESPGGWNLIGRTPLLLFDEHRDESRGGPSLLRAGDRVRFRAIEAAEFERLAKENQPTPPPAIASPGRPLFRVVSPGVQTTVQDLGRPGRQHLGISPGGAMDSTSLRLANLLVGNEENTPAIEATLVGPVLECLAEITIGLAGPESVARRVHLAAGERLDLRQLSQGARAYLAIAGGMAGRLGESLRTDETLSSLKADLTQQTNAGRPDRWSIPLDHLPPIGAPQTIRILRGPQADRFDRAAWSRLLGESYRITPQSSRMGLRCEGSPIKPQDEAALPSQPVCHGTIQIPPNGQPIILGADRQTLGGYPVIAVVASVDWPRLGQLRPGDSIRFVEVDLPTAQELRLNSEHEIAIAATGIRLHFQ